MAGLSWTVLSQVSLVNGFGSLLEPADVGEAAVVDRGVGAQDEFEARGRRGAGRPMAANTSPAVTVLSGNAVPATTPSCTALRQNSSASSAPAPAAAGFQVSRTMS